MKTMLTKTVILSEIRMDYSNDLMVSVADDRDGSGNIWITVFKQDYSYTVIWKGTDLLLPKAKPKKIPDNVWLDIQTAVALMKRHA